MKGPNYDIKAFTLFFSDAYTFIPTYKGKHLLMYKGYTFCQDHHSLSYNCSKRNSGCRGRVKLMKDGSIAFALVNHNHEPPKYVRRSSGQYVKIS